MTLTKYIHEPWQVASQAVSQCAAKHIDTCSFLAAPFNFGIGDNDYDHLYSDNNDENYTKHNDIDTCPF